MDIDRKEVERIVIEDCDGIVPTHVQFYCLDIENIAKRAVFAWESAQIIYENDPKAYVAVINEIQEFLNKVAALARFFWPSRNHGVHAARAKKLRQIFGFDDEHPLKSAKDIRNANEHFDERLDEFMLSGNLGHIFPALIESEEILDEGPVYVFRLLDIEKNVLWILNERIELTQLVEAAFELAYPSNTKQHSATREQSQTS